MTESMLLRLAMVLQNQAPSTLNKYICKLAEAILLEYPDGLNVYALRAALIEHFNLSFTEDEIEKAISQKGQNRITMSNTLMLLAPAARKSLELQPLLSEELNNVIREFISVFPHCGTAEVVSTLLLATVYKGNIIKNLIMDCQSYTKYRPNETTGGIFVSWRRKEELPTGA